MSFGLKLCEGIVRFVFSQAPEDLGGRRWGGASKDGRGGEAGPS